MGYDWRERTKRPVIGDPMRENILFALRGRGEWIYSAWDYAERKLIAMMGDPTATETEIGQAEANERRALLRLLEYVARLYP
jgi:hypothetical protein